MAVWNRSRDALEVLRTVESRVKDMTGWRAALLQFLVMSKTLIGIRFAFGVLHRSSGSSVTFRRRFGIVVLRLCRRFGYESLCGVCTFCRSAVGHKILLSIGRTVKVMK